MSMCPFETANTKIYVFGEVSDEQKVVYKVTGYGNTKIQRKEQNYLDHEK